MSRLTAIEESTTSGFHNPSTVHGNTPLPDANNASATKTLVDALAVLAKNKPSNYYVSNFDPAINNFEVWCNEVDRAKRANYWDDLGVFPVWLIV